ncbi:conjugal transfer protein TraI [Ilyomonas limi]|uniref:Conjugal transfer protein TraI n=1 Tax=Ilyomonas limi TaxID=2575867 RepID=A0A4U3KWW8_9BACT|nr:conjugal transfer protein TraI [Ilyomonas limi]TKK66339.1 conjugal transfer protein TraI [Ilyomonas limi]
MQRLMIIICIWLLACIAPQKGQAQIPIADVIKQGVTKVIKAVDLKVQRLQNKTIWLQNAQKVIENSMSELHLGEITDWVEKQKDLYSDYYNGLSQVKSVIIYYHQIKDISTKQAQLVAEYKHAWNNMQHDKHFSAAELSYMSQIYSGILEETVKNVDQLMMVVNSFVTQMTDAKRIEIINSVAEKVDKNYSDLHQFNNQNVLLSLQRAKDANDAASVKLMYGL